MDSTHYGPLPILPVAPLYMWRKDPQNPRFVQCTTAGLQSQYDAIKATWTPNLLSLAPAGIPPIQYLQIEDVLAAMAPAAKSAAPAGHAVGAATPTTTPGTHATNAPAGGPAPRPLPPVPQTPVHHPASTVPHSAADQKVIADEKAAEARANPPKK